jgi:tetratricopeptide (TPR) repeat protein
MRAFLSHASTDKWLVRQVAEQLGRQRCYFDEYSFETGAEFSKAIREKLQDTDTFVLFVSKESLSRAWVKFEIAEAELQSIKGKITQALVFIIEPGIDHRALPEWLQRGRVRNANSPKLIAREIIHRMYEALRERQAAFFVGRREEQQQVEELSNPIDGSVPPRIFHFHGLDGIGRRTLAARAGRDLLQLPKSIVVRVEPGEELNELAIKLAEHVEPYANQDEFIALSTALKSLRETDAVHKIATYLEAIVAAGELPILLDGGGLTDSNGILSPFMIQVLNKTMDTPRVYLALVSRRRLDGNGRLHQPVASIRVKALRKEDVLVLISRVAQSNRVRIKADQMAELADYLRGYPPTVFFAMQQVQQFGIDVVLMTKSKVIDFTADRFETVVAQEMRGRRKQILGALGYYSPMPTAVLAAALDLRSDEAAKEIEYLVRSAFVEVESDGFLRLAEPLMDATHRSVQITAVKHAQIADAIAAFLADVEGEKRLDLTRNLFRARAFAGLPRQGFRLISDLIQLAEQLYHDREFDRSIEFAKLALEERPENSLARIYLVRALIKQEMYSEADKEIEKLRMQGQLRDAFFLKGFLLRHKHDLNAAITAYKTAVSYGRRGIAVHRELANCYFQIGDYERAREHIDIATQWQSDNRFIVDLQVQISIRLMDERTATTQLGILNDLDEPAHYQHRLSTFHYAFGRFDQAYKAAKTACELEEHPPVAHLSQLIKCEIETGRLDDAGKALARLDAEYPRTSHDIRVGLRVKWAVKREAYQEALILWESLHEKSLPIHKALKLSILNGLALGAAISPSEKGRISAEIKELEAALFPYNKRLLDVELGESRSTDVRDEPGVVDAPPADDE